MRSAAMTAETVAFNKTCNFAELREAHSCIFFPRPQAQHRALVREQPRWFAVVVMQGHPQEAPGKEKGEQGLAGGRRGQCLGHSWHGGIGPELSAL